MVATKTNVRKPSIILRPDPGPDCDVLTCLGIPSACPGCTWNPETSNARPDDTPADVSDPSDACTDFGYGYDQSDGVCFSVSLQIRFQFSSFTYGQCNTGAYDYVGGAYVLTCNAPGPQPSSGAWYVHVTFQTVTGTSQPVAVTGALPGERFTLTVPSLQSAFTKMDLCFNATSAAGQACTFGGGGLSVGFKNDPT